MRFFLAPEYLGNVNFVSTASWACPSVFSSCAGTSPPLFYSAGILLSWRPRNTLFKILHQQQHHSHFVSLFLSDKGLPVCVLRELIGNVEIIFLTVGFLVGLLFILTISFLYFFVPISTIFRKLQPAFKSEELYLRTPARAHTGPRVADLFRMVPGFIFPCAPLPRCVALLAGYHGKDIQAPPLCCGYFGYSSRISSFSDWFFP